MLEFKGEKKNQGPKTNPCNMMKMLESGLINKIYLFSKCLLSAHYVPDTVRGTVVTVQEKRRKMMPKSQTLIKPPHQYRLHKDILLEHLDG